MKVAVAMCAAGLLSHFVSVLDWVKTGSILLSLQIFVESNVIPRTAVRGIAGIYSGGVDDPTRTLSSGEPRNPAIKILLPRVGIILALILLGSDESSSCCCSQQSWLRSFSLPSSNGSVKTQHQKQTGIRLDHVSRSFFRRSHRVDQRPYIVQQFAELKSDLPQAAHRL